MADMDIVLIGILAMCVSTGTIIIVDNMAPAPNVTYVIIPTEETGVDLTEICERRGGSVDFSEVCGKPKILSYSELKLFCGGSNIVSIGSVCNC